MALPFVSLGRSAHETGIPSCVWWEEPVREDGGESKCQETKGTITEPTHGITVA